MTEESVSPEALFTLSLLGSVFNQQTVADALRPAPPPRARVLPAPIQEAVVAPDCPRRVVFQKVPSLDQLRLDAVVPSCIMTDTVQGHHFQLWCVVHKGRLAFRVTHVAPDGTTIHLDPHMFENNIIVQRTSSRPHEVVLRGIPTVESGKAQPRAVPRPATTRPSNVTATLPPPLVRQAAPFTIARRALAKRLADVGEPYALNPYVYAVQAGEVVTWQSATLWQETFNASKPVATQASLPSWAPSSW